MSSLRQVVPVPLRLDGRAAPMETRWSAVGADIVVIETAIPDASVAVSVTSTYLGRPGAETVASHASAALHREPQTWSRTLAEEQVPVWAARHRCLLDHLAVLQNVVTELGHQAELEVDEDVLALAQN